MSMPSVTKMTFKSNNLDAKDRIQLASLIKNEKVIVYMMQKEIGKEVTMTIKLIVK